MKPIYKLNSMNKKFKRLNNIKKFNRVRNERSMNLQLKTKTQLYNNRHGANITVLIPIRDFAKLKMLEVSAISWQYFGWSLTYLQRCEFWF